MAQGPQGCPGYPCGLQLSNVVSVAYFLAQHLCRAYARGIKWSDIFLNFSWNLGIHPEIFTGNEGFLHVRNTTSNIPKDLHVAKSLLQSVIETFCLP